MAGEESGMPKLDTYSSMFFFVCFFPRVEETKRSKRTTQLSVPEKKTLTTRVSVNGDVLL